MEILYNSETVHAAMCLWEWSLEVDESAVPEFVKRKEELGACGMRYALMERAQFVDTMYEHVQSLGYGHSLDWEFIPEFMIKVDTIIWSNDWANKAQREYDDAIVSMIPNKFENMSASEHTLQTVEILCNFWDFIGEHWPQSLKELNDWPLFSIMNLKGIAEREGLLNSILTFDAETDNGTLNAMLGEVTAILECKAPDNFYFGAHRGNGSDFGFWEKAIGDE